MNAVDALVLLAYGSLVVELVVFPIPSEASTWQLLAAPGATEGGGELARARRRALHQKVLLYALPTLLGIVMFLIPLVCIASAEVRREFGVNPHAAAIAAGAVAVGLGRVSTFTSVLQLRAARAAGALRAPAAAGADADAATGTAAPAALAHGLFRWSRNPGLVGMFTFYLGLCLVYWNPAMWAGLPLYYGNMHRRVRMEEAHLASRLGTVWLDYRARVPRYLPLPGLR